MVIKNYFFSLELHTLLGYRKSIYFSDNKTLLGVHLFEIAGNSTWKKMFSAQTNNLLGIIYAWKGMEEFLPVNVKKGLLEKVFCV